MAYGNPLICPSCQSAMLRRDEDDDGFWICPRCKTAFAFEGKKLVKTTQPVDNS